MNRIQKEEKMKFANASEYHMVKARLFIEPVFVSARKLCSFNDEAKEITYLTEEITPEYEGNNRTKVLLLFKNPHPDSVAAGLFLSERHSQSFWERLFEVDFNCNLLPLLNKRDRQSGRHPADRKIRLPFPLLFPGSLSFSDAAVCRFAATLRGSAIDLQKRNPG
jgi:hypothetical protein